jgi:type IV secretion system protein VirB11
VNVHTTPASYAEANLSPLRDLLVSDDVNEVVINPDGRIWVERAGAAHMTPIDAELPQASIRTLGSNLAGETGARLGETQPVVSGRVVVFGETMRVQIVVPPAIEAGVSLSIRKYVSRVLDVEELRFLDDRPIDVDEARRERLAAIAALAERGDLAALLRRAVDARLNVLISGGTSSGKTTLARAMLGLVDPAERIVTIEDAIELHPPHANHVALVADRRPGSPRSPAELLVGALRMRPDRLILGEVRGEEALGFLEAINTGHPGSISTIHADSPALALDRLALMVMRTGLRMTRRDVVDYAAQTIDLIIQVGKRDGRRGVLQVQLPKSGSQHEQVLH